MVFCSRTVAGGNSMMVTATASPASLNIWVIPNFLPLSPSMLHLDFHFHTGRQIELHKRVDGLGGGVDDVDEALMGPRFELFPRRLVDMRGADHGIDPLFGRQRDGAHDLGPGVPSCP